MLSSAHQLRNLPKRTLGDHLLLAFKSGKATSAEINKAIRCWSDKVQLPECAAMIARWEKSHYIGITVEEQMIAGAKVEHRAYQITKAGKQFFRSLE